MLTLRQERDQLTGHYVDSFVFQGDTTVARLMVVGTIKDNKISLQEISYTFIKQGNTESTSLSSYDLEISDANTLVGMVSTPQNPAKTAITLKKLDSEGFSNKANSADAKNPRG